MNYVSTLLIRPIVLVATMIPLKVTRSIGLTLAVLCMLIPRRPCVVRNRPLLSLLATTSILLRVTLPSPRVSSPAPGVLIENPLIMTR